MAIVPLLDGAFREDRRQFTADHQRDELGPRDLSCRACRHGLAIAQHRDAIGQGEDFVEPVRDVDHADVLAPETSNDLEETIDFAIGQRRGRLVHDHDPRVRADRLGDLDDLLLRHAERLDEAIGIDRHPDAFEQLDGPPSAFHPIDLPPRSARLERQRDVLRHGEVGKERRLLIDRGDAEGPRRRRRHMRNRLT